MALGAFGITRIVFFALLLVFALGALALGASITATLNSYSTGYYTYTWTPGYLGIAVGALTIVSVIPLIIMDLASKMSLVTVELVVIGILWVLWLAAAAYLTSDLTVASCAGTGYYYDSSVSSLCYQYQGFQAFCWLAWVLVLVYLILLLTLSILGSVRGVKRVWLTSASSLQYNPQRTDGNQHMMGNTSYNNINTPYSSNTPAPTTPGGGYAPYGNQPQFQQPMMQQQQQPQMMMQQNTGGNYAQNYVPAPGVAQV